MHPHRQIRSYVLRQGRFTFAQRRAFELHWQRFGVDLACNTISNIFDNQNPVVLEIGFGMGESLLQIAQAQPEINFLGIEVHQPGVGALMVRLAQENINNVRIICDDAVNVIENWLPDNSVDKFQIFFPDPWHKKRHNKRRLIQVPFINSLLNKMKPNAILHCATDWQDYAEHILTVLNSISGLKNLATDNGAVPRPDARPLTKYEQRGHRLEHQVWDFMFVKCKAE